MSNMWGASSAGAVGRCFRACWLVPRCEGVECGWVYLLVPSSYQQQSITEKANWDSFTNFVDIEQADDSPQWSNPPSFDVQRQAAQAAQATTWSALHVWDPDVTSLVRDHQPKKQLVRCWLALSMFQNDVIRFSHPFAIAGFPFQTIPYSTVDQSYDSPQERRRRECRKDGV